MDLSKKSIDFTSQMSRGCTKKATVGKKHIDRSKDIAKSVQIFVSHFDGQQRTSTVDETFKYIVDRMAHSEDVSPFLSSAFRGLVQWVMKGAAMVAGMGLKKGSFSSKLI